MEKAFDEEEEMPMRHFSWEKEKTPMAHFSW